MITKDTIIMRNHNILHSQIDGEVVMLSPDMKEYMGMNETGSVIWAKLENEIAVNDIIEQLKEEFADENIQLEKDVFEYINELLNNNLIKIK